MTSNVIPWNAMLTSSRYQLQQISILLELLAGDSFWDIAIAKFLEASSKIAEDEDAILSIITDAFEDGMCILDNFGYIAKDTKALKAKIIADFDAGTFDTIDLDAITEVLATWSDGYAEVA